MNLLPKPATTVRYVRRCGIIEYVITDIIERGSESGGRSPLSWAHFIWQFSESTITNALTDFHISLLLRSGKALV